LLVFTYRTATALFSRKRDVVMFRTCAQLEARREVEPVARTGVRAEVFSGDETGGGQDSDGARLCLW